MKKMLLVFAHPDDESFSVGGTVAKYVDAGWDVQLISATRGQQGSTGPYEDVSKGEPLGIIREKELRAAAGVLGITDVIILPHRDGKLSGIEPGELEDVLYKAMASYHPDIVITFDPTGITNHPDHIKISLSATFAFQKYAEGLAKLPHLYEMKGKIVRDLNRAFRKSFEESLMEDIEPKLYYVCMPESQLLYLKNKKMIPPTSFDKPWKGTEDKCVTTVIDIKQYAKKKMEALRQHVSQQEDIEQFVDVPASLLLAQEYFMLRLQGISEVFMGKNDRVSNKL